MIAGSPAASPARPRTEWLAVAARHFGRIALTVLRFILSFTGWVGGAVLASKYDLHWWGLLIAMLVGMAGLVFTFLPLRIEARGRRVHVFWTCRIIAVMCTYALFVTLQFAVQNQELHEHGVVERAVVTGESSTISGEDGAPSTTYHYSLRALDGPVIHGTLDTGSQVVSVGQHITVLADSRGLADPTLDTHISASAQLLAADVLAGLIAALLAVAAWAWPQRSVRGNY